VRLVDDNNAQTLEKAFKIGEQIKTMNIDPELFRAMLAYVHSRAFQKFGIIPVLDWLNSSYGDGANCELRTRKGRLAYALLRDVEPGEELLWCYNNNNAVHTWLGWGYIDYGRPTLAFLELCTSKEEKLAFENLAIEKLRWSIDDVNPSYKIDDCQFNFTLSNPGKLPTPALTRGCLATSITDFASVRRTFRIFILSNGGRNLDSIHTLDLLGDQPIFDLEFEGQVVACMRTALKNGLIASQKRAERFAVSEVGCSIDTAPYIDMMESATVAWEEALVAVEAICSAQNMGACITVINAALGLIVQSKDELMLALEKIEAERPTLTASLIQKYIHIRVYFFPDPQ
jgi:hypothetical protein